VLFVIGLAYSAVWGTFTSALWTIFFRRLTGREVLQPLPSAYPPPSAPAYAQPTPGAEPISPVTEAPPIYVPPTEPTPPAPDAPHA
jgi:hypothetical protein